MTKRRRRRSLPRQTLEQKSSLNTAHGLIEFQLVRSSHRRTLAIAIDEMAQVRVSVPYHSPDPEIHRFIEEKSRWIMRGIESQKKNFGSLHNRRFDDGHEFLFLGERYPLTVRPYTAKRPKVEFNGCRWDVCVPETVKDEERQKLVKQQMVQWYRTQAEEYIGGRIFHHARLTGLMPQKIAIRTQKRLWGCCDYNAKSIHINWQLILSPPDVVDYVVVHELCHLKHPNHSKRFWNLVGSFLPDYKIQVRWLKEHTPEMTIV